MKRDAETFALICDAIVSEGASKERAAAIAGISYSTLDRWQNASKTDTTGEYLFDWRGDLAPLHVHMRNAAQRSVDEVQSDAIRNGRARLRPLVVGGRQMWKVDPQLAADALDPILWKTLHGDRPIEDVYERSPTGALVPMTTEEPANPVLQLAVLKALGGRQWSKDDRKSLDVRHSGGVVHGVTVISSKPAQPAITHHVVKAAIEMAAEPDAPKVAGYVEEPPDEPEQAETGSIGTSQARFEAVAGAWLLNHQPQIAEPPAPPKGEEDPLEMITGRDSKPASGEPLRQSARAQWEALLAESRKNTAHRRPTGIVNTGLSLLSNIPASREN